MDITGDTVKEEQTILYNDMAFQNELDIQRSRDIQRAINRRARFLEEIRRQQEEDRMRRLYQPDEDRTGKMSDPNPGNLDEDVLSFRLGFFRDNLERARDLYDSTGDEYYSDRINDLERQIEMTTQAINEGTGDTN